MTNEILARLDCVMSRGTGKWSAQCPGHDDTNPSLSIREVGTRILFHCFSGCVTSEIVAALGLSLCDLFTDAPTPHGQQRPPRPVKLDRVALAFQYELGALDLRLRAETILDVAKDIDLSTVSDDEFDRALSHVGRAYTDPDRAELFEGVADTLRARDFAERIGREHTRAA